MKTIFQNVIILSLVAFAFGACKKKDTYKAYRFFSVSSGATGGDVGFNGSADTGTDPVLDCGVLIGTTSGMTIDNAAQKISFGAISSVSVNNAFNATFKHQNLNSTYYTKAYIKDDKGYTYSTEFTVITGCMTVDSIIPKTTVTSSTNLVIWGRNFGNVASNIVVIFNNSQATVYNKTATPTFINNNVLNVNIPSGFSSSDKISFEVNRTDSGCKYSYYGDGRYDVTYQ